MRMKIVTAVAAICLTLSLAGCKSLSGKAEKPPSDVVVCDNSAFIDITKYTLSDLNSKDDQAFHLWANENLAKNPVLIDAYKNLFECWTTYHGKPKNVGN